MTRRNFLEGSDVMKSQVFTVHETFWAPIRDKVGAWVNEGWKNSEEDKPEWFSDEWKAGEPEDMIPKKGKEEATEVRKEEKGGTGSAEGQDGRRNSFFGLKNRKKMNFKIAPAGNVKILVRESSCARLNVRGAQFREALV